MIDNRTPSHFPNQSGDDASRRRELGHFLPLWPDERTDLTVAGRDRVIRLLRKALREERRRGIQGHWAYDLARHAALLRIYQAELRAGLALKIPPARGTKQENLTKTPKPTLPNLPNRSHIRRDNVSRPS